MELRYMGFDQTQNKRVYKFDYAIGGKPTLRFVISVDMVLFLKHRVGIQEGPALCAQKLTADFQAEREGNHELTNEDLLAYTTERKAAEQRKADSRRPGPTRRKPEAGNQFVQGGGWR